MNILENQYRELRVKQGDIQSSQRKNGETPEGQIILNKITLEMSDIEIKRRSIQIELDNLQN